MAAAARRTRSRHRVRAPDVARTARLARGRSACGAASWRHHTRRPARAPTGRRRGHPARFDPISRSSWRDWSSRVPRRRSAISGPQTVTADHLAAWPVSTCGSPRCSRCTTTARARRGIRPEAARPGARVAPDRIVIIDDDRASPARRRSTEGFQRLVADVGMGRVGMVMGLEVSRLARNSTDWHRLLEICALTETLDPRRGRSLRSGAFQ